MLDTCRQQKLIWRLNVDRFEQLYPFFTLPFHFTHHGLLEAEFGVQGVWGMSNVEGCAA